MTAQPRYRNRRATQTEIFDHPSDLVNDVLIAVTALPDGMFWRANTGVAVTASRNVVRFNLPGTPDVLGVLRGRAVAIECKTGSGRLRKKQPNWLLRNSLPVLLDPFLRHLEATAVFCRVLSHLEASRLIPSCVFAYRRQQPPQQAGLLTRWLIAHWASSGDDVCVADWDESNAYCNIPRSSLPAVPDITCPTLAPWLQQFYDAFSVYVVTPHGLTPPYQLLHGAGQGDSGGVGCYLAVGVQRTWFHRGTLMLGAHPRDLRPGPPPAHHLCFTAPHENTLIVPEVCYSDDRRLFARGDAALAHLIDVACHGCWKAGAAVNASKLQTFKIRAAGGRLVYVAGTTYPQIGPLRHCRGGLSLAGIPLIMGNTVQATLRPTIRKLRTIHAGICRLRPSYNQPPAAFTPPVIWVFPLCL